MSEPQGPEIQQFWIGQSVVFGCLNCNEAAHTREGINHTGDCTPAGTNDTEQSFDEWLTEKLEDAREQYRHGPRSENRRLTDVSLGRVRALRDARTEYLNRTLPAGDDHGDQDE